MESPATPEPASTPEQAQQRAEAALRLASIESMRDRQRTLFNETDFTPDEEHDEDEKMLAFFYEIDDIAKEQLASAGVGEDDPHYAEYLELLKAVSYGYMKDSVWYAGTGDVASGAPLYSGRDAVRDKQIELFGKSLERDGVDFEDDAEDDDFMDTFMDAERGRLTVARDRLAAMSADRQGKLRTSKKSNRDFLRARIAYKAQLDFMARFELESDLSDEGKADDEKLTDSQKNALVVAYILDDYKRLRDKTNEELGDKQFRKFVDAFGKFMTKGNLATRVGKGVLIGGATAGAVGFLLPTLGFGAGAAVAGFAATRLSGMTRAYAIREAHRSKDADGNVTIMNRDEDEDRRVAEHALETPSFGRIDDAALHFDKLFVEDTKKEQSARRKSMAWSVGAIALSSTVAAVLHEVVNHLSSPHHSTAKPGKLPEKPAGTGSDQHPPGANQDHHNPQNPGADQHPHNPVPPQTPEHVTYSHDAMTISRGEGWYQTFNEMGVHDPHQQAQLLQQLGPKLQQMGIAYRDPNIGGWGISHSGQMPKAALDLIHQTAVSKGYLVH